MEFTNVNIESVDLSVSEVAKVLADSNHEEQALFFQHFFAHLIIGCKEVSKIDEQLSRVAERLDPTSRQMIEKFSALCDEWSRL